MLHFHCILCVFSFLSLFFVAYLFLTFRKKSRLKLNQEDFEKDVVYLFQFPPSRNVPCISPFGVKVESWLRMKKITYKLISTTKQWSQKGQIPFIEINGQQIGDSNLIIEHLRSKFACEDKISEYQMGVSRAVGAMLDNQTVWSYFYYRYVERAKEFLDSWTFTTIFRRKIIAFFFPRGYKKRSFHHGIGRNSPAEIYKIGMNDLTAISQIMGEKKFVLGDSMSTVDCCLFGHLAQILYIPAVDYPHLGHIKTNCQNLEKFCGRMIEQLWPEWHTFSEV